VRESSWTVLCSFAKLFASWLSFSSAQRLGVDSPSPLKFCPAAAASRCFHATRLDNKELVLRCHGGDDHYDVIDLARASARMHCGEI